MSRNHPEWYDQSMYSSSSDVRRSGSPVSRPPSRPTNVTNSGRTSRAGNRSQSSGSQGNQVAQVPQVASFHGVDVYNTETGRQRTEGEILRLAARKIFGRQSMVPTVSQLQDLDPSQSDFSKSIMRAIEAILISLEHVTSTVPQELRLKDQLRRKWHSVHQVHDLLPSVPTSVLRVVWITCIGDSFSLDEQTMVLPSIKD